MFCSFEQQRSAFDFNNKPHLPVLLPMNGFIFGILTLRICYSECPHLSPGLTGRKSPADTPGAVKLLAHM